MFRKFSTDTPPAAAEPSLTVSGVDAALARIGAQSGAGSQGRRRELVGALFAAATAEEQRFLLGLLSGEVRQGAQAGILTDAIGKAAGVPLADVRRALLLCGDLKAVARVALTEGAPGLGGFRLQVGRPLAPMLAQSAATVAEALTATGEPAAVDVKLDGIRVQVHRSGDEVAVFTRSLDDITGRVPEVVAAVRAVPGRELVLDGEAIALDVAGRPRPFQETSSRAAQRSVASVHLTPYFFDLLHLDGTDLLDEPGERRWAALAQALPVGLLVARTTVSTADDAARAFDAALAAGHEGVVVKSGSAPYDVGRRGSAWVKVKPRHTLDLVVLAAGAGCPTCTWAPATRRPAGS